MMNCMIDGASLFEVAPSVDFWKPARLMTTHFAFFFSSSSSMDVLKNKNIRNSVKDTKRHII